MTFARRATAVMFLLALMLAPLSAFAACSFAFGSTEVVTMTVSPTTITIDPSAAVGTVLATSPAANPNPSSTQINCSGTTNIGVVNAASRGGSTNSSSTIYPTEVAGVGYRLLHPDSSLYLLPWNYDSKSASLYGLSVPTAVQLVKTGPIAGGSVVASGTLGTWQWGGSNGNNLAAEVFSLGSSVTFVQPTCKVTTTSIAVTLPTVSNTALSAAAQTAGATAFNIGLTCSAAAAGQDVAIQFDANKRPANTTGVITLNTSSSAKNVGVQLTDNSFQPVNFGTPALAGTTITGGNNLTYYARYYALSSGVSAGSVSATATFTISYP